MIKNAKYVPIIKTGDAELRALLNLDESIKAKFIPLFELTRGRRTKSDKIGDLSKRLNSLKKTYTNFPFILDLTGENELSNEEIDKLKLSTNNYENWVSFCIDNKEELGIFYPAIQIQEEEDYNSYINKLSEQINLLINNFNYIVFRSQDEESSKNLISDIKTIIDLNKIKNLEDKIIFILDYKYINNSENGVKNAVSFINILNKLNIKNIVITATSFPASVSEHMYQSSDDYCKLEIKEKSFFNNIKKQLTYKGLNLIYGDYASINPTRNDTVTFAKGWIPRIDVPSNDMNIHIRRKRREKIKEIVNNQEAVIFDSYKNTYEELARKVIPQAYFKEISKLNCWGINEIIRASVGDVSGSSPRFWISVRMEIYINLIVNTIR